MTLVRTQFQLTNLLIDCLGKTQTTTSERMLLIAEHTELSHVLQPLHEYLG